MNEGGLRMDNECVKHKALDCIGDLYLLGMPVKGKLISKRLVIVLALTCAKTAS